MRFKTAAFLTAAALVLAIPPASAQGYGPPGHGHPRGEGDPILHVLSGLGLSEAQTAQVKAITAKYTDGALGEATDASREARAAVMKTVHDVNATEDQVRQAAAAAATLELQSALQHHRMAIEISSVLTAEQKTKLAEMFANVAERHAGPPPGGPGGF